jgi:hypothetical protein
MGQHISFGLIDGMEYSIRQMMYKTQREGRLQTRPLWQIAISDRRIHAKAYEDRKKNDIRNKMRDRAELKTGMGYDHWDDPVRFGKFEEDLLDLGEN